MSILTTNLKHFYQWRSVWCWYLLILCQAPVILMPPFLARFDRYLGYLIASLLVGILAGGMQKDVLIKPFSFCLPNHRRIPRAFIFWIGGVVNLILGCVFFGYPGLGFPYILLVVLAGGFLGMIVYLYGVYIGFQVLPTLAGGIIPLFVFGTIFFKWDKIFQDIIISWPMVMILVGGLMCVWCWRLLGRDFLARKYCGKLVMGMFDGWNLAKVEKYRQARADRNLTEGKVKFFEKAQEFFLSRMGQRVFLGRGRYIWGNLYMAFGKYFGCWRMKSVWGFLALIIFFVLSFGFMGPGDSDKRMINFLFLMPAFSMLSLDMMSYRTILFPAGRKEKYYGTLILSAVVTLLAGVLVLAVTGISVFLEIVLPELSFRGGPILSYYGMDISQFYIYLLFMPVFLSLAVVWTRKKMWLQIILVVALMQIWIFCGMSSKRTLVDMIGLMGVAGLVALFWIGFLVILHYVCMRRSLVSQGR